MCVQELLTGIKAGPKLGLPETYFKQIHHSSCVSSPSLSLSSIPPVEWGIMEAT